ncbi:glycosyltransferase family 4 protein [Alkaliphilus transvaalensis]|uniref:glycosyltransferase family 4 protein n=1 Tax=Alkaliphilus transvaalensis TaxID=114628 RepID=UPI0004790B4E|nr:glycosyltransferase family 4 protein [Alkaliphilus transvaalensis]
MEKNLAIFIPNLLTWDGKRPIIGGLERYMITLGKLLTDMGYQITFHQNGYEDFETNYLNWPVYGYKADPRNLRDVIEGIEKNVEGRVLYSSILQQVYYRPNSICISHGVWWERPGSSPEMAKKFYGNFVEGALKQAKLIISCDYNFLNVTRAIYPNLADEKVRVIPNFVDLKEFYPRKKEKGNRTRIVFPRRISAERGFGVFIDVVPRLLNQYPNLEVCFAVDKNNPENLKLFHQWREAEVHKDRILYHHPSYEDMPEIYADGDIVVIPSIYSEGTSFSCLEAMAMGKAILATNVGGLTNLIINGYNGLLIHPSKESIFHALCYLIENPAEGARLGQNATSTSSAFSKEIWMKRWSQCIKQIYPI